MKLHLQHKGEVIKGFIALNGLAHLKKERLEMVGTDNRDCRPFVTVFRKWSLFTAGGSNGILTIARTQNVRPLNNCEICFAPPILSWAT